MNRRAREWSRLAVEAAGGVLIVSAVAMIDIAAGLLTGGVILVAVANFYMGGEPDNAGPDEHDSTHS